MTGGYEKTRYVHSPGAIRNTATDLHALLDVIAERLAVGGPYRPSAKDLDVLTDAVLVAEAIAARIYASEGS